MISYKNVAIILAGGSGSRMGFDLPKQFLKVAGKTVLEHTVSTFQSHPMIDEIAIIGNPTYQYLVEELVLKNSWSKVKKILNGGKERYHSSLSAIKAYAKENNVNLIFHDAVRPLVSHRIITDNIDALKDYNAINTIVSSSNTIVELDEDFKYIKSIPDRKYLWQGQSPQSFRLNVIRKAYELALQDPQFTATDDCGVVNKYMPIEQIYTVKGSQENFKVTYKEDFLLLEQILKLGQNNH